MELSLLTLCYLVGSVTFIIGLKMLSNPASARNGNLVAAVGMTIAIAGTIFLYEEGGKKLGNYPWIFGGLLIGGIVGTLVARKVKMTAMPEMVSMFNGMGGACAALISVVEFDHLYAASSGIPMASLGDFGSFGHYLTIIAGAIIGCVSFAGSMIAWGKLSGKVKDFAFPGQHIINLVLLAIVIVAAGLTFNFDMSYAHVLFYVTVSIALLS